MTLTSDVRDLLDAMPNLGYLVLLKGRCTTKTGAELAQRVFVAIEGLGRHAVKLEDEVVKLRAEVEGLRAQNATQTEALLKAEEYKKWVRGML
jgi:hypothetical protein